MIKNKYKGINFNRTKDPLHSLELDFIKAWQKYASNMEYVLNETNKNEKSYLSERDWRILNTFAQWLGTNVGQSFLFEAQKNHKPNQDTIRNIIEHAEDLTYELKDLKSFADEGVLSLKNIINNASKIER